MNNTIIGMINNDNILSLFLLVSDVLNELKYVEVNIITKSNGNVALGLQ